MTVAIECTNLCKNYGKTTALHNINMKLEENKIYGFLGRNGAGKTTFLNILSAQVFNSSGEIKVFGETAFENDKILSSICFIKDRLLYMSNFKVKDIFSISQDFFKNWDDAFKDKLVEAFKVDVNKKYKALSKGMGAAVGIIIGLASRAPLTIFDESYSGLDAAARQLFYDVLLEDFMDNPRTIIFSTHNIDEVSNIFEEIIILHEGKLLIKEDIDTIREKSYTLSGNNEAIDCVVKNKKVLREQAIGKAKRVFVFDTFSENEIKTIETKGISIMPMSLQELFINLTE